VILEFSIAYSAALCQDNPTFIPSYFSVDIWNFNKNFMSIFVPNIYRHVSDKETKYYFSWNTTAVHLLALSRRVE
jgi:hypothetical protein